VTVSVLAMIVLTVRVLVVNVWVVRVRPRMRVGVAQRSMTA
jgi:hypothetical protein